MRTPKVLWLRRARESVRRRERHRERGGEAERGREEVGVRGWVKGLG